MKVRVLGCSGASAGKCRTTSFLVGGEVLVNAGTGVGDPTQDEALGIDHVLLAHAHLDNLAALPIMPAVLAEELDCIDADRSYPIYITRAKPAETELIMSEIRRLEESCSGARKPVCDIRWLQAGQEFQL